MKTVDHLDRAARRIDRVIADLTVIRGAPHFPRDLHKGLIKLRDDLRDYADRLWRRGTR